jgi:HEPN domain-containing protein
MVKVRKQKFKLETAQKLLKVAQDDLYAAEILSTAPKARPETILYHVQQSIEKSLKAVQIHRGEAVLLTHDIDLLMAELPSSFIDKLPQGVGELTQYATIRRYLDGEEVLEKEDLLEAIEVGRIFVKWAAERI